MAKLNTEAVEKALSTTWRKADIQKLSEIKALRDVSIAMLFSYYKFNKELVIQHIVREMNRARRSASDTVRKFMKACNEAGVDVEEASHDKRVQKKRPPKAKKGEVEKAIEKLSPVLDMFNVNTKNTMALMQSIEEGSDFSQEAIIKSYKVLYTLLMAKAKGETVTRKTSASYEMQDLGNGKFKKVLSPNSEGKLKVWEETQSHLPDQSAFAGALVVMEVIQNLEGGNTEFLTQEEKEDRYEAYLTQMNQERIAYENKEYTDVELIEDEEEEENA